MTKITTISHAKAKDMLGKGRHETLLSTTNKYGKYLDISLKSGQLLPPHIIEKIISELEVALIPAGKDVAERWAKFLIGAYPSREMNDADIFARSLTFDMAQFPEDIIEKAVHDVRLSCKFLPTCAEVFEVCERYRKYRAEKLRLAKVCKQRHEHRERERAELEKRERERMERDPNRRAEIARLIAETRKKIAQEGVINSGKIKK